MEVHKFLNWRCKTIRFIPGIVLSLKPVTIVWRPRRFSRSKPHPAALTRSKFGRLLMSSSRSLLHPSKSLNWNMISSCNVESMGFQRLRVSPPCFGTGKICQCNKEMFCQVSTPVIVLSFILKEVSCLIKKKTTK